MINEDPFLDRLNIIVLENLEDNQFGVVSLSNKIGISRSQLHRKIKKKTGRSISQFIREIRLNEAAKLLKSTDLSVSEVGYKVGFNTPSYFNKCFHDFFGTPPGQIKENGAESIFSLPKSIDSKTTKYRPKRKFSYYVKNLGFILISILIVLYLFKIYFNQNTLFEEQQEKSIAIIPFKNLSSNPENQYFADGLVESIGGKLSEIEELKVLSATSSFSIDQKNGKKVSDIGTELGAIYLIEGSIQKIDSNTRITIHLINSIKDERLWVWFFDKKITDVLKIESEIANQVALDLKDFFILPEKTNSDLLQIKNVQAVEFYQLGNHHKNKRIEKDYEIAIDYFKKAIALEPNFALAYSEIADTYFLKIWNTTIKEEMADFRQKSEYYALKALENDENLVEALTVLATLNFYIDWNWSKADEVFKTALAQDHNSSTLHHRYAEFLSCTQRHELARYHINKAIEINPLSYVAREVSTKLYLNLGQFEKALKEADICLEFNRGNASADRFKFLINYYLDRGNEALENLKSYERLLKNTSDESIIDSIFNTSGLQGLIEYKINTSDDPLHIAKCFSFMGENEKSLDFLEKAYENGNKMPDVPYWFFAKDISKNPRHINLMKAMNLPWKP